jgi:hypothetical protein
LDRENIYITILTSYLFYILFIRKIRLSGEGAIPEGQKLKLKYKDEDGDYISIAGGDDLFLAIDSQRTKSAITIYVELYPS